MNLKSYFYHKVIFEYLKTFEVMFNTMLHIVTDINYI